MLLQYCLNSTRCLSFPEFKADCICPEAFPFSVSLRMHILHSERTSGSLQCTDCWSGRYEAQHSAGGLALWLEAVYRGALLEGLHWWVAFLPPFDSLYCNQLRSVVAAAFFSSGIMLLYFSLLLSTFQLGESCVLPKVWGAFLELNQFFSRVIHYDGYCSYAVLSILFLS